MRARAALTSAVVVLALAFASLVTSSIADAATAAPSTVVSLTPAIGSIAGGQAIVLRGTGFVTGSNASNQNEVTFGDSVATVARVVSSKAIVVIAPPHPVGTVDVRVAHFGTISRVSAHDVYTYHPRPTLTAITPSGASVVGGDYVTIRGTGFTSTSQVRFGTNLSAQVRALGSTVLIAKVPAHIAGTVAVTASDVYGATDPSGAPGFTYSAATFTVTPRPTITGNATVGSILVARPGSWLPRPDALAYQWYVGGVAISGATTPNHVVGAGDTGAAITVSVTATRPNFAPTTTSSLVRMAGGTVPGAPFIESATGIGLGAQVTWAPNNAGDGVTGYAVTLTPATDSSTPDCLSPQPVTSHFDGATTLAKIGGLCAGVVYTAAVTASNATGSGPSSTPSNPVVPWVAQVPDAPFIQDVVGRDGSLTVTWLRPQYSGGHPLTGYSLSVDSGTSDSVIPVPASATSLDIPSLTNGTTYTLTLTALNDVGSSDQSTAAGKPAVAYLPGAPLSLTAAPDGIANVGVSWQPPTDDGGADLIGFQVSYQRVVPGSNGTWVPANGAQVHTMNEPAGATTASATLFESYNAYYKFSIAALNSAGTGASTAAASPVAPLTLLKANSVVLAQATVDALLSASSSAMLWSDPAPAQLHDLAVGDTIVAPTAAQLPAGTLSTVTSITDVGGVTAVAITNASLSDLASNISAAATFDAVTGNGAVSSTAAPATRQSSTASRGMFVPSVSGVRVVPAATGSPFTLSTKINLEVALSVSAGSGCAGTAGGKCGTIQIAGSVEIDPTVSLALQVHQGFAGIPNGLSIDASAKVAASSQLVSTVQGSYSKQIGYFDGTPVTVAVGPVPVVIVPKIPVFLTVTGSASVGIKASITVGASVSWNSDNPGTLVTHNLSTPLTLAGGPEIGRTETGELSVGLSVQPQMDLYDLAGPNVEADVDLNATIDFTPKPGDPFIEIDPDLKLKAGVDLDALGLHASLDQTIALIPLPPFYTYTIPAPVYAVTPKVVKILPGVAQTFTAARSQGATESVTWGILGGVPGDTITPTGTFTAADPQGRTVTVTVQDADGAKGQVVVQIGTPFDPPDAITATQTSGPFTAHLTWVAPLNTGGSPVSSYRLTTAPNTGGGTTSATTMDLTGLKTGEHVVTLYAVNSAGATSPAATYTITIDSSGAIVPPLPAPYRPSTTLRRWGGKYGIYDPLTVTGPKVADFVDTGDVNVAADTDGGLWTWSTSSPDAYLMGNGCAGANSTPTRLASPTGVAHVGEFQWSNGSFGAYALTKAGQIYIWGYGVQCTPALVPGLSGVVAVQPGPDGYALTADGSVYSWGDVANFTGGSWPTPTLLTGLPPISKVFDVMGDRFAVDGSGDVWSWGPSRNGWGLGRTDQSSAPEQVPGLSGVVNIVGTRGIGAGVATMALQGDGTVWAWGDGAFSYLGQGDNYVGTGQYNGSVTPIPIPGLTNTTQIAADECFWAVDSSGVLDVWGYTYASWVLGDNTNPDVLTSPTAVSGLPPITSTYAGSGMHFAIDGTGQVWVWGDNYQGDLGDGNTAIVHVPIVAPDLAGVTKIWGGSEMYGTTEH